MYSRRLLVEVPEYCLGRTQLLSELVQYAKERSTKGCIIALVPGSVIPAGSGKTCLARRLTQALQDVYLGSHVELPLGGSSKELVDTQTAKTALVMRLGGDTTDLERSYQGLFVGEGALRNGVLMLDDVRNADQVLPLLPISFDCCLLLTSRYVFFCYLLLLLKCLLQSSWSFIR